MVRENRHRELLFDLDKTIRQLRAKHGETEEAIALTAHYHNFLRIWTQV
jgi:PKHD-type hydroxylase